MRQQPAPYPTKAKTAIKEIVNEFDYFLRTSHTQPPQQDITSNMVAIEGRTRCIVDDSLYLKEFNPLFEKLEASMDFPEPSSKKPADHDYGDDYIVINGRALLRKANMHEHYEKLKTAHTALNASAQKEEKLKEQQGQLMQHMRKEWHSIFKVCTIKSITGYSNSYYGGMLAYGQAE